MATTTPTGFDVERFVREALERELAGAPTASATTTATTEPATPMLNKPVKKAAGAGQVMASSIIGCRTWAGDFPCTVLDKSLIPATVANLVPEVDSRYTLMRDSAAALLMALEDGDRTLITGPRGAGKSSLVKELCARTNRPFIRINMTRDMESAAFFGQLTVEGGATVWQDGPMTEGVKYGAVVLVDEWDVTPPGIMFGLQYLLEDDGKLVCKEMPGSSEDKTFIPHQDFRIFCAGNTLGMGDETGEYAGTQVQNSATLDRFTTTLFMEYMNADEEYKLVKGKVPEASEQLVKMLVKLASTIRTAQQTGELSLTLSPRGLINLARKSVKMGSVKQAFDVAFANKLSTDERKVAKEFLFRVFGSELV